MIPLDGRFDADEWLYIAIACEKMAELTTEGSAAMRRFRWLHDVAQYNAESLSVSNRRSDEASEILCRHPRQQPEKDD